MPPLQPEYTIEVTEVDRPEDRAAILEGLMQFNQRNAPPANFQLLGLFLKSPEGKTIGGLWGRSAYQWLFVELLFIPEPLRHTGLCTAILKQAEQVARDRGCLGVWLDTFTFQALDFYRKLGYTVFGELKDHPRGISQYWLQKRLD